MSSVRISLTIAFATLFGAAFQMDGANIALLDAVRANDGDRVRTLLADGAATLGGAYCRHVHDSC
jgi:hypothetical protein